MKVVLLAACIVWVAVCAPSQMFMEFDIRHAPAEAAHAIPAGAPIGTLDVLLPVDAQRRLIAGLVRGFIKQEILEANGETKDVFYPFGFDLPAAPAAPAAPAPVAVAPVAPVAPATPLVAPVAPVAPAALAPVAPVVPIIAASAPVAKPSRDDDDDEEEEED